MARRAELIRRAGGSHASCGVPAPTCPDQSRRAAAGQTSGVESIFAPQTGAYSTFPYCDCIKEPSPYTLGPVFTSYGNGTYCFTLVVNPLPASVNGYCARRADVRKIEVGQGAR